MENINAEKGFWSNKPKKFIISKEKIVITTEEKTDFWQRTHYGFRNDNAPAFLFETDREAFSFTVKTADLKEAVKITETLKENLGAAGLA